MVHDDGAVPERVLPSLLLPILRYRDKDRKWYTTKEHYLHDFYPLSFSPSSFTETKIANGTRRWSSTSSTLSSSPHSPLQRQRQKMVHDQGALSPRFLPSLFLSLLLHRDKDRKWYPTMEQYEFYPLFFSPFSVTETKTANGT